MFNSRIDHILLIFGLPVLGYLLGSIPWGLVLTRMFSAADIRKQGSGNIGATNVTRVAGSRLGMLTFTGDILKGFVPVYLARTVAGANNGAAEILLAIVALAAVFGHIYPLYTGFRGGGKGVATTAGCFVILSPLACLAALLMFVLFMVGSRRVSVGSLAAAASLPLAVWISTHSLTNTVAAGVAALFIYIRHAENIRRLISGKESTTWHNQ